jgi:hypothetical protein
MALAIPVEAAVEPDCSDLTVLHMALLGADPFVLAAEATVSGANANRIPSAPLQIPTAIDRCFTPPPPRSRTRKTTLQHPLCSHRG